MSFNIYEWGRRWGLPDAAIDEYREAMGLGGLQASSDALTEAGVQKNIRLQAAAKGQVLWRNNVGAYQDERGNFIRYGLCNETKQMNENIKSSDLIGITPLLITQHHVGMVVGQFMAREVKRPGWRFTATKHEVAQRKFLDLVNSRGGDAAFIS